MLRILGRNNSSNVQKVLWCCDELGIPFTREDYGGAFGKTTEAPYLELNPNSRVPTVIEDDDFVLWESNVIVRYLADKYGKGGLMPRDPRARADADRWMDWQQTTVLNFMTPLFWGLVRTPEDQRDPAALAAHRAAGAEVFAILDRRLNGRDYIMGADLTVADIPLGVMVHRWFALVDDGPEFAAMRAWYARLGDRAPFAEHIRDLPLT